VLWGTRAGAQDALEAPAEDGPSEAPPETGGGELGAAPIEEPAPDAAPADEAPVEEAPADEAPADAPPEETPPDEPLDLSFDLPVFGRTTFSMTSTSTLRFRGQNDNGNVFDDDFFSLSQRFDLALQGDELRLEVRIDAWLPFAVSAASAVVGVTPTVRPAWFGSQAVGGIDSPYAMGSACPPGRDSLCYLAWDVRPERLALRWQHESWTIELGDAQLVLGRGIALSFRKVDLLAVDNALRGGHVVYDDGHLRFRLHGGVANPQNQDPISLAVLPDPEDFVLAGGLGATFGPNDEINVGGHAVRTWFEDEPNAFSVRSRTIDVLGWFVEAPALLDGQLALYAEANAMRRSFVGTSEAGEAEQNLWGRAVYASAQLSLTELTLLVEWKDYRDFLVAPSSLEGRASRIYSAAPSLEFDGPQRLRGIGNQRGASIRMDYAFLPGPWSFSVNFASFGLAEEAHVDPWNDVLVTHGWLGLARRQEYDESPNWGFELTGGYRRELVLTERTRGVTQLRPGDFDREMVHGMLSFALGSGDHALELSVDHRYEAQRDFTGGVQPFQIGGVSVTYTYGIQFVAAVTMRWTDFIDPNFRAQRLGLDPLTASFYPSLELQYNLDPGTFVRGMFGATPGGQICSGGVCRDVPPFEGGMLQFVGRL
jgi:hypothetical protein